MRMTTQIVSNFQTNAIEVKFRASGVELTATLPVWCNNEEVAKSFSEFLAPIARMRMEVDCPKKEGQDRQMRLIGNIVNSVVSPAQNSQAEQLLKDQFYCGMAITKGGVRIDPRDVLIAAQGISDRVDNEVLTKLSGETEADRIARVTKSLCK